MYGVGGQGEFSRLFALCGVGGQGEFSRPFIPWGVETARAYGFSCCSFSWFPGG